MSKIVKLDAQTVLGKQFSIMDTYNNGKIVGAGLRRVYKDLNALDDKSKSKKDGKNITDVDYADVIHKDVIEEVPKLLHLTDVEAKKLRDEMSYSDVEKFYGDCCREFTGITLPTMQSIRQAANQALAATQNQGQPKLKTVSNPKDTSEK